MRSDVELLRIISTFAILWFHSGYQNGRDVAYAGLIVFLIFSAYFAMKSHTSTTLQGKAFRLMVPCMIWSLVYGAFYMALGAPIFPENYTAISKLLSTPSIHLWYLPFLFFCILFIELIKKRINPSVLAVLSVLGLSTLLFTSPQWRSWEFMAPFGQYMHALPAVLAGVFFALCPKLKSALKCSLIGITCTSIFYVFSNNVEGIGIAYLVGIAAAFILLKEGSGLPDSAAIFSVSKLSFGIYLVHPLVLIVLMHFGIGSVWLPILGFMASAMAVYLWFKLVGIANENITATLFLEKVFRRLYQH